MQQVLQDSSNVNPVALAFLLAMTFVVLRASRLNAIAALLLVAAAIPLGQRLVVFGLHFYFFRLLLLVGFCRIVMRGETRGFSLNTLDKIFIAWALTGLICGILRGPSAETFGYAYNSLGTYFLFRFLMTEPGDLVIHLRFLALVALAIGGCMILEAVTHKNVFAVLGGVPEVLMERGDRVRCQGPFRIPILAGTFGATLFPLMVGLWFQGARSAALKRRAVLGMLGCVSITILSNSSGPLLCILTALAGLALWPLRTRMHLFRRGTMVLVIALALVMKAPIWWLIARVSDLVGGGGWHRSYIIDLAVTHFSEWWFIGTSRTANWPATEYQVLLVDPNNIDVTNHYVAQGIGGGIWMLGLFLAIIIVCFKILGRARRMNLDLPLDPKLIWAMGTALAGHCAAFFSISYFDQIFVFWFWLLAAISSLATSIAVRERAFPAEDTMMDLENNASLIGAGELLALRKA